MFKLIKTLLAFVAIVFTPIIMFMLLLLLINMNSKGLEKKQVIKISDNNARLIMYESYKIKNLGRKEYMGKEFIKS